MISTNVKNIVFDDISLAFDSPIFISLSTEFKANSFNILVGQSGSGKSSILKLILGLLTPQSGNIFISDVKLNADSINLLRNSMSWIPNSDLKFPNLLISTFLTNLAIDFNLFEKNFLKFRLNTEILSKNFSEISSGEKQRFFISIADYFNRDFLICDEISSSLDAENKDIVIEFLKNSNKTIICATHDNDLISIADNIYRIANKGIIYGL
jgi:ABC-type transport system involved in cytochrome bd biosynthesis fused ATPase/permease subunit